MKGNDVMRLPKIKIRSTRWALTERNLIYLTLPNHFVPDIYYTELLPLLNWHYRALDTTNVAHVVAGTLWKKYAKKSRL